MVGRHRYNSRELVRYATGDAEQDQRVAIEQHLASCDECRDFVAFVKAFNDGLRRTISDSRSKTEACPDSFFIGALEAKILDDAEANQVRSHMLFCGSCMKEFLSLRRLRREEAKASIPASWADTLVRMKDRVIDLAIAYGAGARVGMATIVAEGPALAMRGEHEAASYSKVLEIVVGRNSYSVEVALTPDGELSVDIAGFQLREKARAHVILRAGSGEVLAATETDQAGVGRLSISAFDSLADTCVLGVTLAGSEEMFLLNFPDPLESV